MEPTLTTVTAPDEEHTDTDEFVSTLIEVEDALEILLERRQPAHLEIHLSALQRRVRRAIDGWNQLHWVH